MKKEAKVMFHKDRFEKMKNKDTFILLRNLYDSIYIMKDLESAVIKLKKLND